MAFMFEELERPSTCPLTPPGARYHKSFNNTGAGQRMSGAGCDLRFDGRGRRFKRAPVIPDDKPDGSGERRSSLLLGRVYAKPCRLASVNRAERPPTARTRV